MVGVVEVVAGHDTWYTIWPSHHEGSEDLQIVWVFESNDGTTTSVTSLVVMVVQEDECATVWHQTPLFTKVLQVLDLVSVVSDLDSVFEFSDTSGAEVLGSSDWFTSLIDDFLIDEWSLAAAESFSSGEIFQAAEDDFQITWPHVFAGVHTETGDSKVNQVVHEGNQLSSDVISSLVQVEKTDKLAVTDLVSITVVFNLS